MVYSSNKHRAHLNWQWQTQISHAVHTHTREHRLHTHTQMLLISAQIIGLQGPCYPVLFLSTAHKQAYPLLSSEASPWWRGWHLSDATSTQTHTVINWKDIPVIGRQHNKANISPSIITFACWNSYYLLHNVHCNGGTGQRVVIMGNKTQKFAILKYKKLVFFCRSLVVS